MLPRVRAHVGFVEFVEDRSSSLMDSTLAASPSRGISQRALVCPDSLPSVTAPASSNRMNPITRNRPYSPLAALLVQRPRLGVPKTVDRRRTLYPVPSSCPRDIPRIRRSPSTSYYCGDGNGGPGRFASSGAGARPPIALTNIEHSSMNRQVSFLKYVPARWLRSQEIRFTLAPYLASYCSMSSSNPGFRSGGTLPFGFHGRPWMSRRDQTLATPRRSGKSYLIAGFGPLSVWGGTSLAFLSTSLTVEPSFRRGRDFASVLVHDP